MRGFHSCLFNHGDRATQADNTQNLESILTAASEAQAKGDFSTAAEYYRQAVKVSPNTAELWANLGLMDDVAGNSSEAIKSFSEAARLNASMFVPQLFLESSILSRIVLKLRFRSYNEQNKLIQRPASSTGIGPSICAFGQG